MNDELFAELLESVREGGAILRGEKAASRRFEIEAPRTLIGLHVRAGEIEADTKADSEENLKT